MSSSQLTNPTKERVKGPTGRRLPSKKAAGSKGTDSSTEEEELSAVMRDFKSAARLLREAQDSEPKPVSEAEKSEALRQGTVDSADFDRAWFFRVPSFSFHTRLLDKAEVAGTRCENNNMRSSASMVEGGLVVVVGEVGERGGGGEEQGSSGRSREGSSQSPSEATKSTKRRFWRNREFNCNIL